MLKTNLKFVTNPELGEKKHTILAGTQFWKASIDIFPYSVCLSSLVTFVSNFETNEGSVMRSIFVFMFIQ